MWPNRRCVWNSSVTNGFNGTANRYTPLQFWFQSYLDAACAPDNVILRAGPLWQTFISLSAMSDRIGFSRCRVHKSLYAPPLRAASEPCNLNRRVAMRSFDYRKFRLFVVKSKLDDAITQERKHRNPNHFRLSYLKKLRLAVKDHLAGHIKQYQPA